MEYTHLIAYPAFISSIFCVLKFLGFFFVGFAVNLGLQ